MEVITLDTTRTIDILTFMRFTYVNTDVRRERRRTGHETRDWNSDELTTKSRESFGVS